MKLAFIVQRYGRDVTGGSESLARQLAERLGRRHEIDVLTTTARDYVTWRNELPEAEEKIRGVRIVRFSVETERNMEEFNRFSDWIYANPHTKEDELKWLQMQGPVVPKLVDYLKQNHERYDLLIFFTYLYYPTYYGLQVAPAKSLLLPTAHDEPALKLEIFKEVFERPIGLLFNTEAEELLVLERFPVHKKLRETIGMGIELLDPPDSAAFRRKHRIQERYLLYAGRIDEGKGVGELIQLFKRYTGVHPEAGGLQLLLIGNLAMKLPGGNECRYLGFLSEEEKFAAMASALALVIPSRYESLSITALEAFSVGAPIVVNARSRVLVDHCRKANAGLYYASYEEFEGIVDALLEEKTLARALGRQGQTYIKEHFGWEKLLAQYERAFRAASRPERGAIDLRPPRPERAPEFRGQRDRGRDRDRDRDRGRRRDRHRDERRRRDFPRSGPPGERPAAPPPPAAETTVPPAPVETAPPVPETPTPESVASPSPVVREEPPPAAEPVAPPAPEPPPDDNAR